MSENNSNKEPNRPSYRPIWIIAAAVLVFGTLMLIVNRTPEVPPAPSKPAANGATANTGSSPAHNAPVSQPAGKNEPGQSKAANGNTPKRNPAAPSSQASAKPVAPRPVNPADLPPDHPPITPDDGTEVGIQWLGYACFYIHSPGGIAVVTDPYDPKATGLKSPDIGAHLVTVSDDSPEHNAVSQVHPFQDDHGNPMVKRVIHGIPANQGDTTVTPIPTGSGNIAYLIQSGSLRIAHLGDLRHPLTPEEVKAFGAVDVLMIPAGGPGLKPAEAAAIAKQLNPRVVLPMTYRRDDSSGPIAQLHSLQPFVSATPYALTAKDTDTVLLSKSALPSSTEIYTLRQQAAVGG